LQERKQPQLANDGPGDRKPAERRNVPVLASWEARSVARIVPGDGARPKLPSLPRSLLCKNPNLRYTQSVHRDSISTARRAMQVILSLALASSPLQRGTLP